MNRRIFLQSSALGIVALALPALAVAKTRPLPAVAMGQRLVVTLVGSGDIQPAHLADAFAEQERFNHRVRIVWLSPERMRQCLAFEKEYGSDSTLEEASMYMWGADLIEADIHDSLIVLETDPDSHPVTYSGIQPIDLSKYQKS